MRFNLRPMSKKKRDNRGFVFSTNPDFNYDYSQDEYQTVEPRLQNLKIYLDRKARKGKVVTLITGFHGSEDGLKALGKELKSKCGVGGTAKNSEIILQGDHREKVFKYLMDKGYSKTKKAGG